MATSTQPFFDPNMAMQQRQLAFDTTTRTADMRLNGQRLQEDANLFRPFLERRFKTQANSKAGETAARGFHGARSGVMREGLGRLGEEQAYAAGEFERGTARGLEDIERSIANLTSRNILSGAENTRGGAGRAAGRAYPEYLNF